LQLRYFATEQSRQQTLDVQFSNAIVFVHPDIINMLQHYLIQPTKTFLALGRYVFNYKFVETKVGITTTTTNSKEPQMEASRFDFALSCSRLQVHIPAYTDKE